MVESEEVEYGIGRGVEREWRREREGGGREGKREGREGDERGRRREGDGDGGGRWEEIVQKHIRMKRKQNSNK